jgi:hypothetical protein
MTDTQTIDIGTGVLGWHKSERVSDRYGSVGLFSTGGEPLSSTFLSAVEDLPFGSTATLKAEVLETRQSGHIGDIARGEGPPGEDEAATVGNIYTLGTGELLRLMHGEYGPYVGVKPDRGPEPPTPQACTLCGPAAGGGYGAIHNEEAGDGYTAAARAITQTFYPHMIGGPNAKELAWHDKIGQAEVDALVAAGRLREWKGKEEGWVSVPRTAAEINALNTDVGMDSHDGINRSILVQNRCEVLGIESTCPTCEGHGWMDMAAVERWSDWDPSRSWLDVEKLYLLHDQTVRLFIEVC